MRASKKTAFMKEGRVKCERKRGKERDVGIEERKCVCEREGRDGGSERGDINS